MNIDDLFGQLTDDEGRTAHPVFPRIEIPKWFEKVVPSGGDESGYNDALFDQTKLSLDSIRSKPVDEWDRDWLKVLQGYKFSSVSMSRDEWDELTGGSDKLYGHGIYMYEVKFMNMDTEKFWPVFFYKDGVECFFKAMVSPMFRGPNGFLMCRYAVRSVDTGRRYIPFKDSPPPATGG